MSEPVDPQTMANAARKATLNKKLNELKTQLYELSTVSVGKVYCF